MIPFEDYSYTPILGWSMSRYDTFTSCKRKYYYQYYGKYDKEFQRKKIDNLKRLTSVPMEIGNVVHDVAAVLLERLVKSNSQIESSKFNSFITNMISESSLTKKYFEVYYGEKSIITPQEIEQPANICFSLFFKSQRFTWLKKSLFQNDQWLIEPAGYGETRLQGMKIYAKVDFLVIVDGKVVIIDWKTGRQEKEKHTKQLFGYSAWAINNLNKEPSDIQAIIAYMKPEYDEISISPTKTDLQKLTTQMQEETNEMYALCSDVQDNCPLDKEHFEMTKNSHTCAICNFKELCKKG
jgi:PD-(D/E)XK nuclease superfamily